ncbi:hypothetical protein [Myxococcus qinghaiensis]|uniref:hypothetical protein n=1 Tax=Myxococcus qinghaiensis TaxID=2906758 RepID=UPI0020A7A1C5|nr:hypothetical protein [Myxococcus qinghaiensis]MCP3167331.1 hypothetical protein [Myxococcus qinghaiensis]
MTAQISDTLIFREQEFVLAAASGEGLFEPPQHGLAPEMISTACYRGYWCTYEVIAESLRLQQLHIGLPPPAAIAARHGKGPSLFEQLPVYSEQFHCIAYRNLSAPVPFTGGLLLAADFVRELYVHMGFHPVWKFRRVYELLFEGGTLVQTRDCSSEMARLREKIGTTSLSPRTPHDREEVKRWIAECFNRQYGR